MIAAPAAPPRSVRAVRTSHASDSQIRGSEADGRKLVGALALIGAVAFVVRLSIMVRGGGLTGIGSYDDGVYYAAADALVHGRMPYRDFLLIQPPLIAVVTAPFAAIGAALSDPAGFALARLAFIGIGAANAVLCGWILRRFGWTAAVIGGLGYALFHPAVYAERSVLLEPLGTSGVLVAVLLLQRAAVHPRFALLAGVAAGLSTGAKIWYVVPALLLLAMTRPQRLHYLIGVAIGGCAIYLPFLAVAPQRMVQQVILDQLGRATGTTAGTWTRVQQVVGAHTTLGISGSFIAAVLSLLVLAAIVTALVTPNARTFGILAVGTVTVLLLTPSWFVHYAALTAPPIALCVGVAAARAVSIFPERRTRITLIALIVLGITGANEANDRHPVDVRTPAGVAAASAHVQGCVTSDDPGALIEMNMLTRDLTDPSCTVWPDVTGWTYDPHDDLRGNDGFIVNRLRNPPWQRDVVAYLESGQATIRIRHATGYTRASKRVIDAGSILFHEGRFVVHSTHH